MSPEIGKARYIFDRFGYAPDGIVSPMILKSWERSRHLPINARNPRLGASQLEEKLLENKQFMDAALPVEQLLYICSGRTMVTLSSSDTCMIHEVCREKYFNQIGKSCQEDVIGTTATYLCIKEGIPVQTVRQENYALRYQHCSFASAPVYNRERAVEGVVSFVTTFGVDLPPNALLMASHGAKLIEQRLTSSVPLNLLQQGGFRDILSLSDHGIMICDYEGCILAINSKLQSLLSLSNSQAVIGHHIGELFDREEDADSLNELYNDQNKSSEINLLGTKLNCLYLEKFFSGEASNVMYGALVFDNTAQPSKSKSYQTSRPITDMWSPSDATASIVGESPEWLKVKKMILKVASVHSARVLVEGESGTGKEQIAKAIHAASGRKGKMITINCGALPKELLQSELFGYVDGAFTGAKKGGNPGKFEMANEGTLFLDEIGEMPLDMQVSLLRVLEERQVVRLGSSKPIKVDLSIIAATNKNLAEEVRKGNFREDLYYRLSAIVITSPPLRNRKSDIPLLAAHLINRLANNMNIPPKDISADAMIALLDHDWPGNVRELLNVLEHALVMEEEALISRDTLSDVLNIRSAPIRQEPEDVKTASHESFRSTAEKSKQETVIQVVNECGGNISKAAAQLKVSRNTIYRYLGKK